MRWSVWRRGGDDGVLMSEAEFEQRWDLVDKYEKMTDSRARCWWGRFTSHARGFISRTDCFPKQCSIYRMLRTSFKPLYWIQSILSEWHSNPARHYLIFFKKNFYTCTGLILKNLGGSSFMHVFPQKSAWNFEITTRIQNNVPSMHFPSPHHHFILRFEGRAAISVPPYYVFLLSICT